MAQAFPKRAQAADGSFFSGKGKIIASSENREHYQNSKRCQELARRGYKTEAISVMMGTPGNGIKPRHIESMLKEKHIRLDGKLH